MRIDRLGDGLQLGIDIDDVLGRGYECCFIQTFAFTQLFKLVFQYFESIGPTASGQQGCNCQLLRLQLT